MIQALSMLPNPSRRSPVLFTTLPFTLLLTLSFSLLGGCGGDPGPDSGHTSTPRAPSDSPNVVLILIDTLRADALSFYGNERETAPYLQGLAQTGTVFAHAYSASTWTAPSTATVLTGVYPDRHGVTRGFMAHFREAEAVDESDLETLELLAISSEIETLAQRFKAAGYDTYGLASNVNIGPEMAFDRGFDHFERHDRQPAKFLRDRLHAWKPLMEASKRPRFVYLHFNDVHWPYKIRRPFYTEQEGRDKTAELRARYESELGYVDRFLRRIHAEFGFDDDTLIVTVADHGEEFREHGRFDHGFTLFNELNQVPFVVHAPGLDVQTGVVAENVGSIDILPTILDLAGLDVPAGLDGRSLADLCRGTVRHGALEEQRQALAQRPLILHRFERGRHLWGVIFEGWKLIEAFQGYFPERARSLPSGQNSTVAESFGTRSGAGESGSGAGGGRQFMLYDRRSDPLEQIDVAAEYPGFVEQLTEILDAHRDRGASISSASTHVEISAELLDRLRELGYVK